MCAFTPLLYNPLGVASTMLAIDIGNTFTRIAAFQEDRIVARNSIPSSNLDLNEFVAVTTPLVSQAEEAEAWVASVNPAANAVIDSALERLGIYRRFIRSGVDRVIRHRLDTPATTGVDRLLAALAAGKRHFPDAPHGYAVVQCGSAATIDVVDAEGIFLGGYILPGPNLWLHGLSHAAQLPDLTSQPLDWTRVDPGTNTRDAILHGLALCLPSAVASAAIFLDTAGSGLPTVATGGWG